MNKRIRQIRTEFDLSQAEFGKKIGISDAAVSKLESGKNTPSETTIKAICSEFGIQYQWLKTGEGPMIIPHQSSIDELVDKYMKDDSELARCIMKSFARLPEKEWTELKNLVDKIRKEGHP